MRIDDLHNLTASKVPLLDEEIEKVDNFGMILSENATFQHFSILDTHMEEAKVDFASCGCILGACAPSSTEVRLRGQQGQFCIPGLMPTPLTNP